MRSASLGRALAAMFAAIVAAVGALGSTGSCSSSPGEPGPGAAGAGVDAGGGGASSSSAGDTGRGGDAGVEGGKWKRVPWATAKGCVVEVARDAKKAVPPLKWDPCPEERPGCSMVVNESLGPRGAIAPASVVAHGGGYRIGLTLASDNPNEGGSSVLYDTDGTPMAAWRFPIEGNSSPEGGCQSIALLLTPSRVWYGAQFFDALGGAVSYYVTAAYDALTTIGAAIPEQASSQQQAASDDTLVLQPGGGSRTLVYDRIGQTTDILGTAERIPTMGYAIKDSVLLLTKTNSPTWEGWIWNRGTPGMQPLIQPKGQNVLELRSDGTTLVWIQADPPASPGSAYPAGHLWTSPFATSMNQVVAKKRRLTAPAHPIADAVAGDGYFAFIAGDYRVHVYRLSDARHWSFEAPVPELHGPQYVDSHIVVYHAQSSVFRQELSALGAGD